MCGRFVAARERRRLVREFEVDRAQPGEELAADYNVAPTKPVYAVVARHDRGEPGDGEPVIRELRVVRWGLVPPWAKDPSGAARLINARVETVATKPMFRGAFARRRCLIPADGFYEWRRVAAGGRSRAQPYYFHRPDGGVLAFAGIYEVWRDAAVPADHPRAWLWTAAIITGTATDEVGLIHDRTPMVVPRRHWRRWLDPASDDPGIRQDAVVAASALGLAAHPVSPAVGSVRANGPGLVAPLRGDVRGTSDPHLF